MPHPSRREFIGAGAATAAALAGGQFGLGVRANPRGPVGGSTRPRTGERSAQRRAQQPARRTPTCASAAIAARSISTRERQVTGVTDDESYGIGIRTLVDGCWGFAATSTMTRAGRAERGARSRAHVARRANRAAPPGRARAR